MPMTKEQKRAAMRELAEEVRDIIHKTFDDHVSAMIQVDPGEEVYIHVVDWEDPEGYTRDRFNLVDTRYRNGRWREDLADSMNDYLEQNGALYKRKDWYGEGGVNGDSTGNAGE